MSGDPAGTCGCCEPAAGLVPLVVENRPGLPQVGYRIGTFSSFRVSMLEGIARAAELRRLTTRRSDDYAITLLELWAAVADVLTFYQERYANEAFLRTATRRESIARLARLIDYRLRPGVSAAAELAFTAQDGKRVIVPAGSRVQSVPAGSELPQTFETSGQAVVDSRRNRVRIYGAQAPVDPLTRGRRDALIAPASTANLLGRLAAGDQVLLVRTPAPPGPSRPRPGLFAGILAGAGPYTGLSAGLGLVEPLGVIGGGAEAPRARPSRFELGATALAPVRAPLPDRDTGVIDDELEEKEIASVSAEEWRARITWTSPVAGEFPASRSGRAFVRRRTFRLFGHDAPARIPEPEETGTGGLVRWKLTALSRAYSEDGGSASAADYGTLDLDGAHERIEPGTLLLVRNARGDSAIVRVRSAEQASRPLPGGPAHTVTRVGVSPRVPRISDVARVSVHELGPRLELSASTYGPPRPAVDGAVYVPGPLKGTGQDAVVLAGAEVRAGGLEGGVPIGPADLDRGTTVLLTDADGVVAVAGVAARPTVEGSGGFGHLRIPLRVLRGADLDAASAVLHGNVASATHGESVREEPLGEGAPSATLPLPRSPLAYVASARVAGADSSLEVRVDDVAWHEAPRLYGSGPRERAYEVDHRPEGGTVVRFGDGQTGAAPPAGRANVTATYRVGGGLAGRVGAGALETALDRPPGLLGVTNPAPAYGGAAAEPREEARRNAPRTVRTFGRAVSLRDFEDVARSSGEVAKASAVRTWDGRAHTVHLTVAGQAGGLFPADVLRRIGDAVAAAASPDLRVRVANHERVPVRMRATMQVAADHDAEAVTAAAREAVLAALSFDAVEIGHALHLSQVFAVLQSIDGVVAVDVDELGFAAAGAAELARRGAELLPGGAPAPTQPHLRIFGARADPDRIGAILPGELATVASPAEHVIVRAEAIG